MSSLNILALESSTTVCGVSIFIDNKIFDTIEIDEPRVHVKKLPVFVDQILDKHEMSVSNFDGIAIASGPGSYTGLRIGMSLAKGLAFSHDLPLVPISTFEELNMQISHQGEFWIAIFSHRDFVYCQKFNSHVSINEPQCIQIENLTHLPVYGFGLQAFSDILDVNEVRPSSKYVGKLAVDNFDLWKKYDIHSVISNYLTSNTRTT
jgi:tRNA threonylcarbamoyladenosine biosynthesis protein TsaB